MIYNFYITCHFLIAARCQNNSVSEEETEVPEECEFPDFTPFLARFRTYKRDLSETNKIVLMSDGMESLRDNALMKGERDLARVETEIFGQPDRMELVFNYIDLLPIIPYIL